jgi:hypothetical protein
MKQHVFDFQHYQGRLTPTPQRGRIDAEFCAHLEHRDTFGVETRCQAPTINGDQWCYQHKDPDGYAERLAQAYQEAQHAAWRHTRSTGGADGDYRPTGSGRG